MTVVIRSDTLSTGCHTDRVDILSGSGATCIRFICHPDNTMTTSAIRGFLTKKEVTELYGRSHRSLTRDFSSAVRVGDREVLAHLKILTDDETVREGTDVTLDQIQDLSNRGLSPTWYVERAWAAKRYGVQSEPQVAASPPRSKSPPRSNVDPTVLLSDESVLVRRLEEQIKDLQGVREKLYSELSIKNEQIKQANDRTRESNVLMKELQTLLGDVQQRALLPLPIQPGQPTPSRSPSSDVVVEGGQSQQTTTQQIPKAPAPKARQRSVQDTKRKSKSPSITPSKAATDSTSKDRRRSKWYEFPTVKKIFTRRP